MHCTVAVTSPATEQTTTDLDVSQDFWLFTVVVGRLKMKVRYRVLGIWVENWKLKKS